MAFVLVRRQLLLRNELGVPGSQGLRSFQDTVSMSSIVSFPGGARLLLEGIIIGLEGEDVAGSPCGCHCRVGQGGCLLFP